MYTEPYYTVDGVSRTIEGYQKSLDPTGLAIAQYASKTLGAALGFGVPITETDTINFGAAFEHTNITLFATARPCTRTSSTSSASRRTRTS